MNTAPVTNREVQFILAIKPLTIAKTVNQLTRTFPITDLALGS